ncbi:flagellar basal-body rod protein FlgF [Desulforamulus putei]|uniref:Flagellar hook protein FlgE n=1 Tax=Desulforamulus putei DSM 12395 TaxID=1121429 RepID=A0A1M5B3Y1_9FIRM|nr:flagellar basal-body rod protein FlgF [Desulforamulus putei]SHF37155.1 flagellar hook protein FlgE [Desulforamulus putei DSM 12395]
MIRSLYAGVSGMRNHQTRMDVVGNNIANVNTTGYKSSRANFQDSLSQFIGTNPVLGQVQVGTGVKVGSVNNNFTQGPLQSTGRPLDLAIQGDGFFELQDDAGQKYYTREGVFFIDKDGYLVNSQGLKLCDTAEAPIQISMPTPPNYIASLNIAKNGTITIKDDTGADISPTSAIGLAIFPNPGGLKKQGGNLYIETPESGSTGGTLANPGSSSTIESGYLEMSNVDLTEEFTNMITTQRGYQANARVITVSDTLLEELIQLKR